MTALTSGPFGDRRSEGAMPHGTFLGTESPMSGDRAGAVSGIEIDGAWYSLAGQPPASHGGTWGDLSWMRSPCYAYPGLL